MKTAPAVGDFLVFGERIGDQRKQAQVLIEGLCQRVGRGLSFFAISILKEVKGCLQREAFAVHIKAKRGHSLIEKPVPGGGAGDRFFQEELLDLVIKLVRLVFAQVLYPGPVMRERRVVSHSLVDQSVVDLVELKREKQQMRASFGHALLRIAKEFGQLPV